MLDVAGVRALQTEKETLEQTINRLISEERKVIFGVDTTLAHKTQFYQELLHTGVRNESNWQEPIPMPITKGVGMLIGMAAGAALGGLLGVGFMVSSDYAVTSLPYAFAIMGSLGAGTLGFLLAEERYNKALSMRAMQHRLLDLTSQEPALLQQKGSANARIGELNGLYENLNGQSPAYRASFKPDPLANGQYSKLHVKVENAGTGPATSLTVLIEGQLEGETKAELGDLPIGKSAEAQLSIKPTAAGQMKWQAKIVCEDILGRERTLYQPFWVEAAEVLKPTAVAVGGDYMPGGQKVQTGDASVVRINRP